MTTENKKTETPDSPKTLEDYQFLMESKRRGFHIQDLDHRARSISVGHCGGGVTEIVLRPENNNVAYAVLQPIEVIELLHQMAASVGCHIQITPRDDFGSWRNWNSDVPLDGGLPAGRRSGGLPRPEEQPGLQFKLAPKEKNTIKTKEGKKE